jgi:hypothetical protein
LNRRPPQEVFENGNIISIVGKQGTRTHKGKHEVNFEYSSFKPMLVKRDTIDKFFVIGDVDLLQMPPSVVAVAISYAGVTMRTAAAITATATKTKK